MSKLLNVRNRLNWHNSCPRNWFSSRPIIAGLNETQSLGDNAACQSASNPQTGTTSKTVTTMTQTVTTSAPSQAGSAASQTGASANQTGANPSEVGVTGNQNKIKGCLGGSAATGIYTLTDSQTGATYTLIGSTDKLRTHVGEEVEITSQGNSAAPRPVALALAADLHLRWDLVWAAPIP